MKPLFKALIAGNLLALLLYVGYYVHAKEDILAGGELVLLELAPVDPRSLLQGDYMRLNYAVSQGFDRDSLPRTGYLIVERDVRGVGQRNRFQPDVQPLAAEEYAIGYRIPDRWQLNIGAESYFFQEGKGDTFAAAKYGGLRVDAKGNSLLVGLYNEDLELIR
ncbi:MAG: GDYXXLXY domain-containing protein [Bacteroidota bacterium]